MQEALVAAHENHRGATDLRGAPLEGRAATARHLLRHIGGVALCTRRGVAEGRRQVAVAPIDRGTDVDRLRIDDVADDGALQLLAECLAGLGPVPAQIHHQLAAVTLPFSGATNQRLLRVLAHRVPVERRGGRTRPGAGTHVHAPVNGLGQIVQHAPLARPLVSGSIHGISRQVTGPVLRLERRHELLVVGLQRPRGDSHARRAAGAAGDVCQDARHFRQEAAAVAYVDVFAVTVDGSVPEVIDGRRTFGLDPARPLPRTVHDVLQPVRIGNVPFHAEPQRVGGDVLPERRVSIIGCDQIFQIRTQVTFPGVHRIVGQRTPSSTHEGANGLVLIRRMDLALTAARPIIDDLFARRVVGLGRIVLRRIVVERVLAVRHQDVIGAPARQMLFTCLLPRRFCPGPRVVSALEVLVHRLQGTHQRCTALGSTLTQPFKEGTPVFTFETANPSFDNTGGCIIDDTFGALVDASVTHPDVLAQCRGKGVAHGGNGHVHPRAVILEPVGKVLVFLRLRAGTGAGTRTGHLAVSTRVGPHELLVVHDGDALVVAGAVFRRLEVAQRPPHGRLVVGVLEQIVRGRRDHGDAAVHHTTVQPPFGLKLRPDAGTLIRFLHPGLMDGLESRDVHGKRSDRLLRMPEVILHLPGVCIRHPDPRSVHPGVVAHIRIVVQRIDLRRTLARSQQVIVARAQKSLNAPGRVPGPGLGRMESEQMIVQVGIGQEVEGHRPRIVQREHQVRLDDRKFLDDQRFLRDDSVCLRRQGAGHQQQGGTDRLRERVPASSMWPAAAGIGHAYHRRPFPEAPARSPMPLDGSPRSERQYDSTHDLRQGRRDHRRLRIDGW